MDIPGAIGVELELFPYIKWTQHPLGAAPAKLFDPPHSVVEHLLQASTDKGGRAVSKDSDKTEPLQVSLVDKIQFDNADVIQFEPGGQVELCTAPCTSIHAIQLRLQSMKELLGSTTSAQPIRYLQMGTNPWFTVHEIGNQLNRPRYRALEQYFGNIGDYGKQMMLQTASLHINVELGRDPSTRVKRVVAANLLAPFATALFAHSSVVGGAITHHKAHRSFIWQHADNTRTGILQLGNIVGDLEFQSLVDIYTQFALQAPVLYIPSLQNRVFPREITLDYWLTHGVEGGFPLMSDIENHLSMLFPEVRLKGYIEIRTVDAPPLGWELVPVMFYAALLYSEEFLERTIDLLLPLAPRIRELQAMAVFGLESNEIYTLARGLLLLAIDGLTHLPEPFAPIAQQRLLARFYEEFTSRRKTFADDMPSELIRPYVLS